ncbi:MAG: hypothetical protein AB8B71_17275 [Paracoccaceae bacterium]
MGCAQTYVEPAQILTVPGASVGRIVQAHPDRIAIAPFETAMQAAQGQIVVTSCGFLSFWQDHLAACTDKPFIASALIAVPDLCQSLDPSQILTVTFDADSLSPAHFRGYPTDVVGLTPNMHLRQVISQNLTTLDVARAGREIADLVAQALRPHHKQILLECTNLPPYREMIKARTDLPITDILTCIETTRPGAINPQFLPHTHPDR